MHDGRFPVDLVGGVPVVAAPEEIDITNAPELRSALLEAATEEHVTLVADLTRTRFCDSSGVHSLLVAHKRAQADGGELLLVIPDAAVLRVFAITGIDRMIPSFTSLDDALAYTSPGESESRRRPDDGLAGSAAETTGVDPDVEVTIAPHDWAAGGDPQLDTAVRLALQALEQRPPAAPPAGFPPA